MEDFFATLRCCIIHLIAPDNKGKFVSLLVCPESNQIIIVIDNKCSSCPMQSITHLKLGQTCRGPCQPTHFECCLIFQRFFCKRRVRFFFPLQRHLEPAFLYACKEELAVGADPHLDAALVEIIRVDADGGVHAKHGAVFGDAVELLFLRRQQ